MLEPERTYEGYLLSKNWFDAWRDENRKEDPVMLEPINYDLLHQNPFNYKVRNLTYNNEIIKNHLEVDINYMIVTPQAWLLIQDNYPAIPLFKRFYLDFNWNFIEAEKTFAINLLVIDKNEINKELVCVEYPVSMSHFLQMVFSDFEERMLNNCFQADTRISNKEIEQGLKEGRIFGKKVYLDKDYSFDSLKTNDILIINIDKKDLQVVVQQIEKGICYLCKGDKFLDFICECEIVGYCSIDCKYEDFYVHGSSCKPKEFPEDDFKLQMQRLQEYDISDGKTGMVNIGNSCYLNSLVQILKYQIDPYQLLEYGIQDCSKGIDLSFLELMYEMWYRKNRCIEPWFFKIYLGLLNSNYLYFMQNDSHECLMTIIDELQQTNKFGIEYSKQFIGKSVNQIKCKQCQNIIEKEEKFYVLSLPLTQIKAKWQITYYVLQMDQESDFWFAKDSEVFNMDIIQDNYDNFLNTQKLNSGILYLTNKHCVLNQVSENSESLEKIYKMKLNSESAVFYFQPLVKETNFLGVSVVEQKASPQGLLIQNKLFSSRLIEFTKRKEVSAREIYSKVWFILNKWGVLNDPKLPCDITYDFLNHFLNSINGQIYHLKKFQEESPVKGFKYNLFTFDDFLQSQEKLLLEKQSHETPQQLFELFKEKYTQQLIENAEFLQKMDQLDEKEIWSVYIHNQEQKCQNCGQNDIHVCRLALNDKIFHFQSKIINIQIYLGTNLQFPKKLKDLISLEKAPLELQPKCSKKNSYHLMSCFEGFFQKEEIEYKCEKCENRDSTMNAVIREYPQILVFHLKRFQTIFTNDQLVQKKNEKLVEYDNTMRIENKTYQLIGIINHRGELGYGHYTSYAYNPILQKWFFFNDKEVRPVDDLKELMSIDNYVLFYKFINQLVIMEQERFFFIIGCLGSGKSTLINKILGNELVYQFDKEKHFSYLEIKNQENSFQLINNTNAPHPLSFQIEKIKNFYEIPLRLETHEKMGMNAYNLINRKCQYFQIVCVIPFNENQIDQKVNEVISYLQNAFNNQFDKQIEKVALVFTKLWDHQIQFVEKLISCEPLLKNCFLNFFTMEGELKGGLEKLKGQGRRNLDLGFLANIFGIKYYIIESVLRSQLTIEMIEREFEYFKSLKKQNDPIIKKQFEKFILKMCFEIRARIYQGRKEEEQFLLSLLNTEINNFFNNFDIYLQYNDLLNLRKSYLENPEELPKNEINRKNTNGSDNQENEIIAKMDQLREMSLENRDLILNLKQQLLNIKGKIGKTSNDNLDLIQTDNLIQNLDQINKQTMEDINNIQPYLNQNSFGKKQNIENEIKCASKKSQKTFSILDDKEYIGECNHEGLKLEVAIKNDDLETFKQVLEEQPKFHHIKINDQYLFDYLKNENKKDFNQILKHQIKKRFKGSIHKYSSFHQLCRIRALIFLGISVNKQNEEGQTPLFQALQKKGTETIQYLIEQGADVNFQDHQKMTPLIWAVKYPYIENVKLLIDNGAFLESKTESGMTALMWAASFGYLEIVQLLVKEGSNINNKDNNDRTALQVALQKKQTIVAQYLQSLSEQLIQLFRFYHVFCLLKRLSNLVNFFFQNLRWKLIGEIGINFQ